MPDRENDDSKTLKSRRAVLEISNGFRHDSLAVRACARACVGMVGRSWACALFHARDPILDRGDLDRRFGAQILVTDAALLGVEHEGDAVAHLFRRQRRGT